MIPPDRLGDPGLMPEGLPPRRVILLEDALILLCLGALWLPILGHRGPLAWLVLTACLAAMLLLLGRRKRRFDAVLEAWRRRLDEQEAAGGLPWVPGDRLQPPDVKPAELERH